MHSTPVEKPKKRGVLRRVLGKEYFIQKRHIQNYLSSTTWAQEQPVALLDTVVKTHTSQTLRKLRNVDMYLQHNKVTNLQLAIEKINRIVIAPGEVFSFWKLVGRPTKRKGYIDGMVLENGKVGIGTGGGLCQLGNMIYWMALHTSLTVRERWRHCYDVFPDVQRTLPFGSGATLSYNYIDLQIENTTTQPFQLHFWIENDLLHGEIRSVLPEEYDFEVFESDHKIEQQWWGGFTRHNKIWQRRIDKKSKEEVACIIAENHAIMMYNPLLAYSSTDFEIHKKESRTA